MNNFFTVFLEDGTNYHFRSELNAYKFLWETYLRNCPNESEDMKTEAKEQLDEQGLIDGIGAYYESDFED